MFDGFLATNISAGWKPGNPGSNILPYGPYENSYGGTNYDPILINYSNQKDFYTEEKGRADITLVKQADPVFSPDFERQKEGAMIVLFAAAFFLLVK